MAIVTLTFDLSEQTDKYSYEAVLQASEMKNFIEELCSYLRTQSKYADTPDSLDKIRERVSELLTENSVDLDKMS